MTSTTSPAGRIPGAMANSICVVDSTIITVAAGTLFTTAQPITAATGLKIAAMTVATELRIVVKIAAITAVIGLKIVVMTAAMIAETVWEIGATTGVISE